MIRSLHNFGVEYLTEPNCTLHNSSQDRNQDMQLANVLLQKLLWPSSSSSGVFKAEAVAFVLLFSTVHFQMFPQIVSGKYVIITLVAFFWLFTTVCFHMPIQSACIGGCIITLVALFSTVRFQMFPQMACLKECVVTLIALV